LSSSPIEVVHVDGASYATSTSGAGLLFVSGQVALADGGSVVGRGDASKQAEFAFLALFNAVQDGGSSPERILKLGIFVVGTDNINAVRESRDRAFEPYDHRPASTLLVVPALVDSDLLVEVDCVALLEDA
jgi:enamine deaminase RidA (YjgF/YER057c/UK114 family)